MKLFNRDLRVLAQTSRAIEPETHAEPAGHVHPNYRHWAWFRPTDSQDNKR